MRWITRPPLHFAAIGAALFALGHLGAARRPAERPTVVITAARLAELEAEVAPGTTRAAAPDPTLVDRAVDDEILYQEALARGLGRDDPAVRWRLAEKMRFLAEDEPGAAPATDDALYRKALALGLDRDDAVVRGILVRQMRLLLKRSADDSPPDDAELRAYVEAHPGRYVQPARVSLWHVFVSADRGRATVDHDARALLDRLQHDAIDGAEAARLGDVFQPGAHLRSQSAQDLARTLGAEFAAAVLALEPGVWAGPVRSPYGLHLVRIEERTPAGTAPLDAVRSRVVAEIVEERREARLAAALDELRARWAVRVESPPGGRG